MASFLTSAPEIRNKIYHELWRDISEPSFAISGPPDEHALLKTCRSIRHEASSVWYAHTWQ